MKDELDNIKNAWKAISEAGAGMEYSAEELHKIVRKRSNNELDKIRRKILLEWSLAIVLSVLLVLFIHLVNPADTRLALFFIGAILALSLMPYVKVIRLKYSNHPDLRTYLREFIVQFNRLIQQYIRMATFVIPLAGLGGFLFGLHGATTPQEWQQFFTGFNVVLLVLFVAVISMAGYWLQRRYFKWIYGKNMQRLNNCLADLDEVGCDNE